MKILVVDDELKIREVLREYLEFSKFEVVEASDGLEAVELVDHDKFDLIIMDVMMPKLDGMSAVKEIKKKVDVPVIMLSARGEEYDKLFGFEAGVDDYVVKPFSPKEIIARINVILKRKKRILTSFGGVEIDFEGRNVYVDKEKKDLTQKEFQLLNYLIKNKGIAISREKLLNDVWGYDFYGDDRTIDTHIKMLRNRLGNYKTCIVTLRGFGYKFEYEEEN